MPKQNKSATTGPVLRKGNYKAAGEHMIAKKAANYNEAGYSPAESREMALNKYGRKGRYSQLWWVDATGPEPIEHYRDRKTKAKKHNLPAPRTEEDELVNAGKYKFSRAVKRGEKRITKKQLHADWEKRMDEFYQKKHRESGQLSHPINKR
jgi:hypothetical protein